MSICKDWCFTLNNYTDADVESLRTSLSSDAVKYAVFGYEVGDNGTPHLQGFVSLEKKKRLNGVKAIVLARSHLETRKGSKAQAIEYCKKDDNFEEFGDVSMASGKQGHRTDLDRVGDMVKSGASLREVAEEHPSTYIKFNRGISALKVALSKPYTPEGLRGLWLVGDPGTGKSRYVHENYPGIYLKQQNKWWDNYQGEQFVLLDDLDTDKLAHHLKLWSDRYPVTGEVKGGSVNLTYDKFIVTSNFRPFELLKDCDQRTVAAVERRFSVHEFRLEFTVEENARVDEGTFTTVIDPPISD